MKQVGLHLRMTSSLDQLVEKAVRLELPFFQCFFVVQHAETLINPSAQDITYFTQARYKYFEQLYVHGSYWINLAGITYTGHRALERELYLARMLEFTHFVLHPGSAKGAEDRMQGIDAVARALNQIVRKHQDITLVLENTAHGNMTVGGDIEDLAQIYAKLDRPERIAFCIDTAHAHAYGYDIISSEGRNQFITLVDETIGFSNVALLHINDTHEKCGSKLDKHQMLGQGALGIPVLQAFVTDTRLRNIPALAEPPIISEQEERELLQSMRSWYADL